MRAEINGADKGDSTGTAICKLLRAAFYKSESNKKKKITALRRSAVVMSSNCNASSSSPFLPGRIAQQGERRITRRGRKEDRKDRRKDHNKKGHMKGGIERQEGIHRRQGMITERISKDHTKDDERLQEGKQTIVGRVRNGHRNKQAGTQAGTQASKRIEQKNDRVITPKKAKYPLIYVKNPEISYFVYFFLPPAQVISIFEQMPVSHEVQR